MLNHFDLWAKTEGERWHALIFHLIDVGACAEALWERLDSRSRAIAIAEFGSYQAAIRWLAFLAATHDIGKANRCFQSKNPAQRVRLGLPDCREDCGHGYTSGAYLKPWLETFGFSRLTSMVLAHAVAAHHGTYFSDTGTARNGADEVKEVNWGSMANQILDELSRLFGIDRPFEDKQVTSEFAVWLTGFVSVADWLGSNELMMTWQNSECDLENYLERARRRAQITLDTLEILKPEKTLSRTMKDLLPAERTPNGMQMLADHVAKTPFGLAIIEAPTGEGKTEAAFRLAEEVRSEGGGVYIALPTQATANGIFERASLFLEVNGSQKNRLIHSASWLYRDSKDESSEASGWILGEDNSLGEDWFQGRGRALIAPYGTGTIDQVLISVLTVKHFFVRLWALAGKVIIVDEVHAYDEYMQSLMRNLLGWLRVLNCKVVLLSATLPNSSRKRLLEAWNNESELPESQYPCITWIDDAGVASTESFEVSPRKPMRIECLVQRKDSLVESGCKAISELMDSDVCTGALLFNTVDSAQTAFEYLKRTLPLETEVMLFHARFTMEDRKAVESKVLQVFGREAERNRKRILVATQVVEQSLDLDFDVMVTELAPIDLLIQRAGRLHRHSRDESGKLSPSGVADSRPNPVLHVIAPKQIPSGGIQCDSKIYDYVIQFCTHEYIKNSIEISTPTDVAKAVNTVYDDFALRCVEAPFAHEQLTLASREREKKHDKRRKSADNCLIDDANSEFELLITRMARLKEEPDGKGDLVARTRLEEFPTMSVIVTNDDDLIRGEKLNWELRRKAMLSMVRTLETHDHGLTRPQGWNNDYLLKDAWLLPQNIDGIPKETSCQYVYNTETGLRRISR